jgi:hypothetical protein
MIKEQEEHKEMLENINKVVEEGDIVHTFLQQ